MSNLEEIISNGIGDDSNKDRSSFRYSGILGSLYSIFSGNLSEISPKKRENSRLDDLYLIRAISETYSPRIRESLEDKIIFSNRNNEPLSEIYKKEFIEDKLIKTDYIKEHIKNYDDKEIHYSSKLFSNKKFE